MKKLIAKLGVVALIAIPFSVLAVNWQTSENYAADQIVEGNLYVAAGNPVIESAVTGDLTVFGGNVRINGDVKGDVAVAGGEVWISGKVDGDVRAASGNLTINSQIGGELIGAAGSVNLGPNANVQGDLLLAAGEYKKDANAKIGGTEKVYTETEKERAERPRVERNTFLTAEFWMYQLFSLLSLSVAGLVFFVLFNKYIHRNEEQLFAHKKAGAAIGIGFAALFGTPILIIILMISGIGFLLGLLVLFMYIYEIILGMISAGIYFGSLINKFVLKSHQQLSWWMALIGLVVLHLISLIPAIGWLVALIMIALAIGINMLNKWKLTR